MYVHFFYLIIIFLMIIFFLFIKNKCNKHHHSIEVKSSEISGRGFFAKLNIKENDIIETCPYIEDECSIFSGVVGDYIFKSDNNEGYGNCAVAFGYCSLYNHNDDNSANWVVDNDSQTINIIALRDINEGEEITVSYGSEYWNARLGKI